MGHRVGKNGVRLDDGTVWFVDILDEDGHGVGDTLRYAGPSEVSKILMTAAEIISSYTNLLRRPVRRRNEIIREIKHTLAKTDEK